MPLIDAKGKVNLMMLRCLKTHIKTLGTTTYQQYVGSAVAISLHAHDTKMDKLEADVVNLSALQADHARAKASVIGSFGRRHVGAIASTAFFVGALVASGLMLSGILLPVGLAVAAFLASVALGHMALTEQKWSKTCARQLRMLELSQQEEISGALTAIEHRLRPPEVGTVVERNPTSPPMVVDLDAPATNGHGLLTALGMFAQGSGADHRPDVPDALSADTTAQTPPATLS